MATPLLCSPLSAGDAMMGRYFKRLAHRSGMLEAGSPARQTAVASNRDVVEINQQAVAPVHASEQASRHNMGAAPTKAVSIRADAIGVTHSVDHANPEPATTFPIPPSMPTPSKIEESLQNSTTNNSLERQSVRSADPVPEQPVTDQVIERTEYSNSDDLNAAGQLPNSSYILDAAIGSDLSKGDGLGDTTTSFSSGSLLSDPSGRGNPGDSSSGAINELNTSIMSQASNQNASTTDYLSIRGASLEEPGLSGLAMSASDVQGMSYTSSLPMPDRAPLVASKQNIEVRIGSVTMEVHQKQPTLVMNPQQPRQTGGAQSSSQDLSSGFRPSRYYLRGL
jgi:hypothetical protein